MKNSIKRILSILLVVAMLSGVGVIALADVVAVPISAPIEPIEPMSVEELINERSAEVQVNGAIIGYESGVRPYYNPAAGRVYVPFRDLFTALGFMVDYVEATRTAVAVKGDLKVEYVQGSDKVSVTEGDTAANVIALEVAPITRGGRVLVPIRFFSEAIGVRVGWDGSTRTVIIIDTATLLQNDNTYEILGKLQALNAPVTSSNTKTTADAELDISVEDGADTLDINFNGTATMIANPNAIDVNANLKMVVGGTAMAGVTSTIDVDMELIVNLQKGLIAFQSDDLYALSESFLGVRPAEDGTWITIDMGLPAESLSVATEITAVPDIKTFIDMLIEDQLNSMWIDSIYAYEEMQLVVDLISTQFADSSFEKQGNNYVSKYTVNDDYTLMTVTYTIKCDAAGTATAFVVALSAESEYGESLTLSFEIGKNTIAMQMSLTDDYTSMTLTLNSQSETTTQVPRTDVPAGAKVVDINDIF